jgi:hypothetical protein
MAKKQETHTKKKTSSKEVEKIEKPKKMSGEKVKLTEKQKEERRKKIELRNESLVRINEKKENSVKSNISKYYDMINTNEELIKLNLKKNTKERIKNILGVKQVMKGGTSLLFASGLEWMDRFATDLHINLKYSNKKMLTSDIVAYTLKNMDKTI